MYLNIWRNYAAEFKHNVKLKYNISQTAYFRKGSRHIKRDEPRISIREARISGSGADFKSESTRHTLWGIWLYFLRKTQGSVEMNFFA
jgi:hypothetical protein